MRRKGQGRHWSVMLRRFCCLSSASTSSSSPCVPSPPISFSSTKKPLVFLGSPTVSATVLDALLNASTSPDSFFEVVLKINNLHFLLTFQMGFLISLFYSILFVGLSYLILKVLILALLENWFCIAIKESSNYICRKISLATSFCFLCVHPI